MSTEKSRKDIACSSCFSDQGLRFVANSHGKKTPDICPNCKATERAKLTKELQIDVAHLFFVWGSFHRVDYGGAPLIQFNDQRDGGKVTFSNQLSNDSSLIESLCGIGFFHYKARLWMRGEMESLRQLQDPTTCTDVVDRILSEYP